MAVLSIAGTQAMASADVTLGVRRYDQLPDSHSRPWCTDVMPANLAGVWRLLHAPTAASAASRRGIKISTKATTLV